MIPPTRPFTPAWLAGDPSALSLLPGGHRSAPERARAVARASERRIHPALPEALEPRTAAQRERRDALVRPGAVAVVTGQQCGLFGGPLFTLHKAASALVDARTLEQETGAPCAAVFWLQDEDHDFAEIATCHILGADGGLHPVGVPELPGDQGRSVSSRRWGPAVSEALDATERALAGAPHAGEVMALLRRCYPPEASPAASLRDWLDALFGDLGLLVLDPCSPALREAAEPLHRRADAEAGPISALLEARSEALRAAGFEPQVHVRPGAPLSFHHPEGPEGPRRRVDRPAEGGSRSTSALLRPLLQDTWLPTAACVLGPGELAYFAQLPPLYAHFGLPLPLIVPRARFRVVDDTSRRLLEQLGLAPEDLAAPREALLARLARPSGELPDPRALEEALRPLAGTLAELVPAAERLDPGLRKAVDKTSATVTEAVARLTERYRRELARRDGVTVDRLDRLRARLLPDGLPQERVHGWPGHAARHGVEGFVRALMEATAPFDGELRELRP